ncbi:uncharacterized protein LOC123258071 [Drosophila ananassae]|uniref:Putative gag-pol protein n=1 Tax=Drosophila ananassae TaxID=7217 RepID=A7XDH0_DROAN|nr:uncharacterized protein LOC123258071 [Drosophila ananassae]ABP48078.1 putative gag-pol protein [Drosophila ananassae]
MEQLKRLKGVRGRLKSSLTKLLHTAENSSASIGVDAVEVLLVRLDKVWNDFELAGDDLSVLDDVEGWVDPADDYDEYEAKYIKARALLFSLKRSQEPTTPTRHAEGDSIANNDAISRLVQQQQEFFERLGATSTPTQADAAAPVRETELPKIHIKPFGGIYKEWPAFKALYISTVHSKQHLGKIQKYHYLKSFLVDEAASLVRHLPISETAYDNAWERLNERYDRPRQIIHNLLDTFMELPSTNNGEVSILRSISDGANEVIRALDSIGHMDRDCWVIHLLLNKIDPESRRKWVDASRASNSPKVEEFFKFLDARCEEFELCQSDPVPRQGGNNKKTSRAMVTAALTKCVNCNADGHQLSKCPQFIGLSIDQRRSFVKHKSLCFNCLKPGHRSSNCSSKYNCQQCGSRHHTLIHTHAMQTNEGQITSTSSSDRNDPDTTSVTASHMSQALLTPTLLSHGQVGRTCTLPTALVHIRNSQGTYTNCRVLLDTGSELSYVSERCIKALGLNRAPGRILISGISSIKADTTRGFSTLTIKSRVSDHSLQVKAHILGKITSTLARENIDASALEIFNGIPLADTEFNSASPIDVLLGTDSVWAILTGNRKLDAQGNIIAISTIFGWVITSIAYQNPSITTSFLSTVDIHATLQRFWEIEDSQITTHHDPENVKVEEHFQTTHSRDSKGRYTVELPFKDADPQFTDTLQGATQRFASVERRLHRDTDLHSRYVQFMQEYISLGHMRQLNPDEILTNDGRVFYMPHHPVLGKKLRVVFDGSFQDSSGQSLNDTLNVGPSIQRNLFDVCVRFRLHKYVFSADIIKMFRQIWINKHHRNYQRIVWREHPSAPLLHYQLCTVTYGTACAPFLAVRVLEQLARDYQHLYPTAARILLEDFYVDDVLTGADTEEKLLQYKQELIQLMSCAQLELGKWISNSNRVVDPETTITNNTSYSPLETTNKVLGIHWQPHTDTLAYKVSLPSEGRITKRQVLSDVSRIFDPLGLLAPVVIQFKILFQELWVLNLDWDSPLPLSLEDWYLKCKNDINTLNELEVPRYIGNSTDTIELHAFSDASIKAYAAAVYSRVTLPDGNIQVTLIAAKTRVAPLKTQSLPRLELCGALLLSRLINSVKAALKNYNVTVYAWCDSTIVLAWLSHIPAKLKTFVANRTAEILSIIPRDHWQHVKSDDNPADCASRGMLAADLVNHNLWWKGPHWLYSTEAEWVKTPSTPHSSFISDEQVQAEVKGSAFTTMRTYNTETSLLDELIDRVSSWPKLLRILAYVLKFIRRTRRKSNTATLTLEEIHDARILYLRHAQDEFQADYKRLLNQQDLGNKSKLRTLSPQIDKHGLLRVGGRLGNSELPADVQHPIIMPKSHRITKLILEHEHRIHLHPGVSALFVIARQRYWVFGARNLIRKITHDCLKCFRQRQHTSHQFMSDLPSVRVRQAFPFANTGCDYAGPITLKVHKGRNPRKEKGYICLFVCLATSALHLELATDLTTDTFLAALRRFISRRGKCLQMYSDNGRNFVGAKRVLNEMQTLLKSDEHNNTVLKALVDEGINWNFIPPHAPHWGGKWESAVRSVKLHLHRVIGKNVLTFEKMHTLLAQIEAVVNSRPLFSTSDTEVNYLSPAHFLIGRPYTTVPEGDLSNVPINRLDYWQQTQAMLQGFWKQWHMEYLTSLQHRPKWMNKSVNMAKDDIVLLKDSHTPPAAWPLGRVIETYPGKDGMVRAVRLRTPTGETTRPIVKLALLPNSETVFQGRPGC